jgi:PhzF family phenazine biosynthesis protein
MTTTLYVVDAFTNQPFAGNPAAVCALEERADGTWMQLVAREMNHSETAFLHANGDGWNLRWFTPAVEVDLCGHATLASAFALWETGRLGADEAAKFHTRSGMLTCHKRGDWIEMDFPAKPAKTCTAPAILAQALGATYVWAGKANDNYLVEVENETLVRALKPDFNALASFASHGVIITAQCDSTAFDFVSRYFAPAFGVNEDPATGSAHCTLGPYWSAKLCRNELSAFQASTRGGTLRLRVNGERVLLCGQAVMMGRFELQH